MSALARQLDEGRRSERETERGEERREEASDGGKKNHGGTESGISVTQRYFSRQRVTPPKSNYVCDVNRRVAFKNNDCLTSVDVSLSCASTCQFWAEED